VLRDIKKQKAAIGKNCSNFIFLASADQYSSPALFLRWRDLNSPFLNWQFTPLYALWQRQSQAWLKEEGETKRLRYGTVSLNINTQLLDCHTANRSWYLT